MDQGDGLSPPASDLALIQQGEISQADMVHVTTKRICLSADVIHQMIKAAKVLVTRIMFTKNVMVCIRKKKQRLIDQVIEDSVPQFFGPNGHVLTVGEYRTAKINCFIHGADPLLFMHDVVVDVNNNINVHTRFQNRFMMTNVICFVWYWGNMSYIEKTPLKALKCIHAVAGAAMHCALHEQGRHILQIDPFSGTTHQEKFNQILNTFKHLTPADMRQQ
ncbi:hypothetical protein EDD22DRAFT_852436 [Suillus occidentalis]|nr:hypothetical protein EDD22DRAFT_852436 [Suillus occidentalis]